MLDGSASFHRASVSSPVLPQPLTNLGGTILIESNRLCISSMESRVSGKGKLLVKGNLPLNASESFSTDRIDLKCEKLKVQAKNVMRFSSFLSQSCRTYFLLDIISVGMSLAFFGILRILILYP